MNRVPFVGLFVSALISLSGSYAYADDTPNAGRSYAGVFYGYSFASDNQFSTYPCMSNGAAATCIQQTNSGGTFATSGIFNYQVGGRNFVLVGLTSQAGAVGFLTGYSFDMTDPKVSSVPVTLSLGADFRQTTQYRSGFSDGSVVQANGLTPTINKTVPHFFIGVTVTGQVAGPKSGS